MKIRHVFRLFLLPLLSLPSVLSAALVISWPSAPSSVNGGTSYTVTARATSSNAWPELFLYKNGSLVASNSAQSAINVSTTQTDSGGQSITYFAEAFDTWDAHQTSSISVSIIQTTTPTTFSFSNLSHTYDGNTKTASVTPSPGGASYTSDLTKGPGVGSYTVSATATGSYVGSGSATLTISQANQATVNLSAATSQGYGTSQTVSVSGGSGTGSIGPYIAGQSSAGNATLSGTTLTANASSGWVDLMATRNGDGNYNAAYSAPVRVNFTAAATTFSFSNLTHTYDGSTKTASVTPSPAGATYTSDLTKGPNAGTYTVSATANGNYTGSGSNTLTINKANQTITFNNPGAQTYGTPLTLSATATSGGTVTFAVTSGPATISGTTLTFTGTGSVTVTASQTGTANYNAATNVAQTFTVNKANQTITFNQPAAQTFGSPHTLVATASSGLTVSFVVTSGPATVSGATLTFTGAGSVVVTASQAGDGNYNAATNVARTITVGKATPTGTFANRMRLAGVTNTYTVVAGDLDATFAGGAGMTAPTGTITYSLVGPGTAVSAGTVLSAGTTPTIRASYPGDSNYNAAVKDATWTITNDSDGDTVPDYIETALGTNTATANATDSGAATSLKIHKPN